MVLSVAHTFATLRPSLGLTLCPDAEFSVSVLGTLLSVSEPVSLWASAFVSPTTNILVRDVGGIIAHVLLTGIVGEPGTVSGRQSGDVLGREGPASHPESVICQESIQSFPPFSFSLPPYLG